MTVEIDTFAATQRGAIQAEQGQIERAKQQQSTALEEVFLALCAKSVAEKLESYHQARRSVFEGVSSSEKRAEVASFESWLDRECDHPNIIDGWVLYQNDVIFSLGRHASTAAKQMDSRWRKRLPRLLEHLKVHPVLADLSPIELVVEGKGDSFKFVIRFRTASKPA